MIRRPPRSTLSSSSAASDVYKRQGDMNTECNPGSCVAAMISSCQPTAGELHAECANDLRVNGEEQPTEKQLQAWAELHASAVAAVKRHRVRLSRVGTGHTRSCFEHGKKDGPCVPWRLDHMFYTGQGLQVQDRWATLECDPEGTAAGLPNHTSPSDHLPIAASFTVLAIAEVPEERKQEIASIAAGVEQTQLEELRQVHETQGEVQRTVEQEEAAAAAPEENVTVDEDDRKKKKSKKGKPSAKMIACIQAKRAIVKAVQEEHRGQRQAAVAGLGDQELDVLEKALGEAYGLGIEGWVEQGSAALKKAAKA
eukprot:TRINITY_DN6340_c0_g1_i2.p1 TRINITY_DN6340_c0_g1~~TRINITY_DN6340_c0_g1_i2.p1  ORF type:complete len:311 (-),score=98.63 TRINITY_DN6340_c0_g1_i2:39-971(-)